MKHTPCGTLLSRRYGVYFSQEVTMTLYELAQYNMLMQKALVMFIRLWKRVGGRYGLAE